MNDGYRNDPAINEAGVFWRSVYDFADRCSCRSECDFELPAGIRTQRRRGGEHCHQERDEFFARNSGRILPQRCAGCAQYFNPDSQPKAPFHNNQYGGSLGGPIIRNKTFFYADYEGQQEPVGVVTLACVPVGTAPNGSLSPSQASNPVIAALIARNPWPAPNLGTTTACPNSSVVSPSFNRLTSVIGKIDHHFNINNSISGRYFFGDSVQSFPLQLTASGGQLPGFNTYTPTRVQLVSMILRTHDGI